MRGGADKGDEIQIYLAQAVPGQKKKKKNHQHSESLPVSKEVVVRVENGLKKLFVTERAAGTVTGGITG